MRKINSLWKLSIKWFYQRYEHQCIYDADYLTDMLRKAGFTSAVQKEFRSASTGNYDLLLDDEKYSWESLYAEAVK